MQASSVLMWKNICHEGHEDHEVKDLNIDVSLGITSGNGRIIIC
jgi:hypothetical protein